MQKKLLYTARILAVLYIVFISLFALDVFSEGYSIGELLIALFVHLIPSFILAGITWLSIRNALWGGVLFLTAGVSFTLFFNTQEEVVSFLLISCPLLVIGGLFVLASKYRK